MLDPDVVIRSDGGALRPALSRVTQGATEVARQAITYAPPDAVLRPALVNGAAGVVVMVDGSPFSVMGFTVVNGKIAGIDALADPERIERLDLSAIDG